MLGDRGVEILQQGGGLKASAARPLSLMTYCLCCCLFVFLQATVIAIANIYYGILHMWELGVWTWASYTAVLCSIVAVSVVKDTSDFIK
jgi:hypothetical protein